MCGVDLPERHRHTLDEQREDLLCVCRACALLFERDDAGRGRYRLVPTERRRLPEVSPRDLGIPVSLAFVVTRKDGTAIAHYPSAAGATRWEIDTEAWRTVLRGCPQLAAGLTPGVRALLVNAARGHHETWIVPIDDCYRLVALIHREWKGLSGGDTVWPAIEEFFAGLQEGSPHG